MGICRFEISGIQQVRRGHITFGYGDSIRIVADTLPQLGVPNVDVTVMVSDGDVGTIILPGCRIDRANITYSTFGHIVRVHLLGPTWRLRKGSIDGLYNVVRPDGTIEPSTQRSVQELAELLFRAMGWPGAWDVSGLPSIPGPQRNWHGSNAYAELTRLCHEYGCDWGLDALNYPMLRVWRMGSGSGLPTGGFDMTADYGVDVGEPPDAVKVYCSPTRFQSKLKLRCMLPDTDGAIKPYADVSYAPADGWDGVDPNDPLPNSTDKVAQGLAKRWLYKLWMAESQADGSDNVPGYGPAPIGSLLPLFDELAGDFTDDLLGQLEQRSYLVGTIAIQSEPLPVANSEPHTHIEVEHRLIGDSGLVTSPFPLTKLNDLDQWTAADVFMVCSYNISDATGGHKVYHSLRRQIANNGTGDEALHRPEFYRRVIAEYDDENVVGTQDNETDLNSALNDHIDAFVAQFQTVRSAVKMYNVCLPMSLDGTRQQVSYTYSIRKPNKGVRTIAAASTEWEPGIQRRHQRRIEADGIRARSIVEFEESVRRRLQLRGVVR